MVRSLEICKKIQKVLSQEDWNSLKSQIEEIDQDQGSRRVRKNMILDINRIIIDTSLKSNKPAILQALQELQNGEIDDSCPRIIRQYITTKDNLWLETLFSLSENIEKKSSQSRIFAKIAKDLIEAGVTESDPTLIQQGLRILERISFRKYRSEMMIDIIPLLIVWAITQRDKNLIYSSLHLIEDIGDISKRSVLHAELVKALATVAILEKDKHTFFDSIQTATTIHQKIRRQDCITEIIEKGSKSGFGNEMEDVPLFLERFTRCSHEAYLEIVSAITGQVLERLNDKNQIIAILDHLCRDDHEVTETIIIDLLIKAERSGDPWFLITAMDLLQHSSCKNPFPLRELVRAGISVAKETDNMQVLSDLRPILNSHCTSMALSRIYLQFSQIMLSSGSFSNALEIFGKIDPDWENPAAYTECLIQLLKNGILNDSIPLIYANILKKIPQEIVNTAIYRTVIEVNKGCTFEELNSHILSIRNLILLHPKQDHLILESITLLADRGFLDSNDPGILIKFAESIREQQLKERAISSIVIKIAKIGVKTKNRDFLQRAVGLTCEIDGQISRSAALSSIIDEASALAAQQGDLDLLLRMKVWSDSLLEKKLVAYAMANIIDGVIKYALDRHSSDALEAACQIADDIDDPSLKVQLFERIAECFVKIGCMSINRSPDLSNSDEYIFQFLPFERSLDLIKNHINSSQISLKIAGIIDIIISYSRSHSNQDYIIPLAMFAVEIKNPYERDAMMSRIISNLNAELMHTNSTDPYESMVILIRHNDRAMENPTILQLLYRVVQMISDPYTRLIGLCDLAELFTRLRKITYSRTLLDSVTDHLEDLVLEYQKVLVLSHLASSYCQIKEDIAERCLMQGIQQLGNVEPDKDADVRHMIVRAIVQLNTIHPDTKWSHTALEIAEKISEPVAYVNTMILVHSMLPLGSETSYTLLHCMEETSEKISSPYERSSILLSIVPPAMRQSDVSQALSLVKKAEGLSKKINIPSVADSIRIAIADFYTQIYQKNHDKETLSHAILTLKALDDDEIRFERLKKIGYSEVYEITPTYIKIRTLAERVPHDSIQSNHVSSLERGVWSITDRGKEAIFFCYLSIFFKKKGYDKISRRMLQNSIDEARIIRPLSRRSFVMCDIALKFFMAGCEQSAQEILDLAIDAATNIRQSSLRDTVFDELGLAIKIMQRIE